MQQQSTRLWMLLHVSCVDSKQLPQLNVSEAQLAARDLWLGLQLQGQGSVLHGTGGVVPHCTLLWKHLALMNSMPAIAVGVAARTAARPVSLKHYAARCHLWLR
jgi:hypothetical protein